MSASPSLPRGATFRGNLLAELTRLEDSQVEGRFLVEGITFTNTSTRLALVTGRVLDVPAFVTAEELHDDLRAHLDIQTVSETSWATYPGTSVWGHWLILHHDLALLERNMAEEVPGLHYTSIVRDGENATVAVAVGLHSHQQAVPLAVQPLGIPIDLAHAVMTSLAASGRLQPDIDGPEGAPRHSSSSSRLGARARQASCSTCSRSSADTCSSRTITLACPS